MVNSELWIWDYGEKAFKQPSGLRRISSGSRSVPMSWQLEQELQRRTKGPLCCLCCHWLWRTNKQNLTTKTNKRKETAQTSKITPSLNFMWKLILYTTFTVFRIPLSFVPKHLNILKSRVLHLNETLKINGAIKSTLLMHENREEMTCPRSHSRVKTQSNLLSFTHRKSLTLESFLLNQKIQPYSFKISYPRSTTY